MDRTLTRARRRNRRRQDRNWNAWQRYSPDGNTCRHCPHDASKHLSTSGQPHYYRRATEAEESDPSVRLYRHHRSDGPSVPVRRVTVAKHAEIIATFCTACADEIGTAQVLCYQRTLATGEVVGTPTDDTIAA